MKRKPPIVAIRGNVSRDTVSQPELRALADLQAAQWRAERITQRAALEIESRIAHGAAVQPGALAFDQDLKMVRTKREKVG